MSKTKIKNVIVCYGKSLINPFHGNVLIYFNTIQYSAANTAQKNEVFHVFAHIYYRNPQWKTPCFA